MPFCTWMSSQIQINCDLFERSLGCPVDLSLLLLIQRLKGHTEHSGETDEDILDLVFRIFVKTSTCSLGHIQEL